MSRTIELHTPLGPEWLKFSSLRGEEALSRVSEFELEAVSLSPDLDARQLLGQSVTIKIETQDRGTRHFNARVADFVYIGPDSGAERLHRYRASLRSWLWLADKNSDYKIFQNKTVPEIVKEVLRAYYFPFDMNLNSTYKLRPYVVQYAESDLNFVARLCEEEGIFHYCQHADDNHSIVFTDGVLERLPGYADIPFLAPEERRQVGVEYIHAWCAGRALQSGLYATDSYDFRQALARLDQHSSERKEHAYDNKEIYEWSGAYVDPAQGAHLALVRRQQQQLDHHDISAITDVRGIAPGYLFALQRHPRQANNTDYLIVGARYHFHQSAERSDSRDGATQWLTHFTVKPAIEQYRPPRRTPKPKVIGPQTAVVTGPAGHEIFTNEYGQVKVLFRWDRHSKDDENSSCWIRVASSWAGANWGEVMLPRIGQEVVVEHLHGDADLPLITGRVNNQYQMPSSFSQTGNLPGNRTLAGLKSKEHQGGRYNQLLFDDTRGQIRTQLESEHERTQLNLGYLTHPRLAGSADARGEGFELRTDGWGALRAARGLHLTSCPQKAAGGQHLDSSEATGQLDAALGQAQAHSTQAQLHHADALQANDSLAHLKDISGQQREQGKESTAAYKEAILLLSSPAGIAHASQKAMAFAAATDIHMSSQLHTSMSVGRRLSMAIGEAWSVFVDKAGIKLFAGKGKVQIQAQSDNLELVAQKDLLLHSVDQRVEIAAGKEILLTAGGGYIRMSGGNIEIHCPGTLSMRAGNFVTMGPTSLAKQLPVLPKSESKSDEKFMLRHEQTGEPLANRRYQAVTESGQVITGVSDAEGRTQLVMGALPENVHIEVFPPDVQAARQTAE